MSWRQRVIDWISYGGAENRPGAVITANFNHPATPREREALIGRIKEGYSYNLSGHNPHLFSGAVATRTYIDTCCDLGRSARSIEDSITVYTYMGPVRLTHLENIL